MKIIETINNALDTVQSIEGILREAREYAKEAGERSYIFQRVGELEIENRKLLEANHGLAEERESELADMRAKSEPVASGIGEPDYGIGFEKCSKAEATEACLNTGGRWGAWLDPNLLSFGLKCNDYRFRRPITKPIDTEPQWVACTAEEAAKYKNDSEWNQGDNWFSCNGLTYHSTVYAFRTKAKLSEWVTVSAEVWKSKELEDCERQRESTTRVEEWDCKVKRADVTIGTVLG